MQWLPLVAVIVVVVGISSMAGRSRRTYDSTGNLDGAARTILTLGGAAVAVVVLLLLLGGE